MRRALIAADGFALVAVASAAIWIAVRPAAKSDLSWPSPVIAASQALPLVLAAALLVAGVGAWIGWSAARGPDRGLALAGAVSTLVGTLLFVPIGLLLAVVAGAGNVTLLAIAVTICLGAALVSLGTLRLGRAWRVAGPLVVVLPVLGLVFWAAMQ
jgi:hypothetical protein